MLSEKNRHAKANIHTHKVFQPQCHHTELISVNSFSTCRIVGYCNDWFLELMEFSWLLIILTISLAKFHSKIQKTHKARPLMMQHLMTDSLGQWTRSRSSDYFTNMLADTRECMKWVMEERSYKSKSQTCAQLYTMRTMEDTGSPSLLYYVFIYVYVSFFLYLLFPCTLLEHAQ